MRLVLALVLCLVTAAALAQTPRPAAPAQPTRAEVAAIQRKVQNAWIPPPDAADVRRLQIDLRVALNSDGAVLAVRTVDQPRLLNDEVFRQAAESAEAAVWRASPLPVPRDKAQFFKQFTLRFAPPTRPAN
jgi:colicin import membrane protein